MKTRHVLVGLIFATTAANAATSLTRGPYLQLLTDESVTIVWRTAASAKCGVSVRALTGTATIVSGSTGTTCAIAVTGLQRGTQYAYRPLADGVALTTESTFKVGDPSQPYTFLVVGDSGDGGSHQMAVRDRMNATPADFMVHTGDMIYDSGAAGDFDSKFFKPYADLIRRLVFWPCLGNHDVRSSSGQPWRDAFYTPANNAANTENYYSFDYGNAHVVVLNSNASTSPGSAQYKFLDEDLAASTARWKFVAFHHPIYSSSHHGSYTGLRNDLLPLFDTHAVDIVFMGHDHDYERTTSMRNNKSVAAGAGTVYVTTGGGGRSLYSAGTSSFTAFSESSYNFTKVAVSGDRLTLQMIRENGSVGDTLTLIKGPIRGPTKGPTTTTTIPAAVRKIDLQPSADTYIEAGTEATWDHGLCKHFDVDTSPFGVSYLKFDLSWVRHRIVSAVLELYTTNSSRDGGSVYSIPTSSWVEGTGNGLDTSSAGGPGLKWTDVDLNHDGVLDSRDGSRLVPIATRRVGSIGPVTSSSAVQVDVTAAVLGNPGFYTIAIMNGVSDGATYSSRNASKRHPVLHLTIATVP
jgi:Calcineurin-like phosphoesterase/Iron/zinc purple acid phosphatase-like protein C